MTVTAEILAALEEAYRIWHESKGERYDQWLPLLADDCRFGSLDDGAPGLEFTKACRSKDEMIAYYVGLVGDWDMVYYLADEFIAERDRVVVLCRSSWRNRRTGKLIESCTADVWRFERGKAVEIFEFTDTAKWAAAVRPD
jgi:ketosteroid isomerase-like protein